MPNANLRPRRFTINYQSFGNFHHELPKIAQNLTVGIHHAMQLHNEPDADFLGRMADEIDAEFKDQSFRLFGSGGFAFWAEFKED